MKLTRASNGPEYDTTSIAPAVLPESQSLIPRFLSHVPSRVLLPQLIGHIVLPMTTRTQHHPVLTNPKVLTGLVRPLVSLGGGRAAVLTVRSFAKLRKQPLVKRAISRLGALPVVIFLPTIFSPSTWLGTMFRLRPYARAYVVPFLLTAKPPTA